MSQIYRSPLRVFLALGFLAILGLVSGWSLPVSLFPRASRPVINFQIPYGSSTAEEFVESYGRYLEAEIQSGGSDQYKIDKIEANYSTSSASIDVTFSWGTPGTMARQEMERVLNGFRQRLPEETRDQARVWENNEGAGFFAATYSSLERDPAEIYSIIQPLVTQRLSEVKDAGMPVLFNPEEKEVRIELKPQAMTQLQVRPRDVEVALKEMLVGRSAGSLAVGTQTFTIEMPRVLQSMADLSKVIVTNAQGKSIHLTEVADVRFSDPVRPKHKFRSNGLPAVILYATPKAGGNIKRMSDQLTSICQDIAPQLPKDILFSPLVDPSEFIQSSVNNVFHEVVLAALLAVLVLYLFVGNIRNTVTAAVEIPLSIILSFILMRLTGVNLNLVSLGGLALSAGMNVDASVVVLENIVRHLKLVGGTSAPTEVRKLAVITAVREVWVPILASTLTSLVVFVPLAFTSEMTSAILGDLAKAVIFSHLFSAIVALVLVPTVRMTIMNRSGWNEFKPPIGGVLQRFERFYEAVLTRFFQNKKWRTSLAVASLVMVASVGGILLPRLPKELVGKPETDWLVVALRAEGNSQLWQMEDMVADAEARAKKIVGDQYRYMFAQFNRPESASVMVRIRDRSKIEELKLKAAAEFFATPYLRYFIEAWNPSELPIPTFKDLEIQLSGGTGEARAEVSRSLEEHLNGSKILRDVWSEPNSWSQQRSLMVRPHLEQWEVLGREHFTWSLSDIADLARVATDGRRIGDVVFGEQRMDVVMRYPKDSVASPEDLGALGIPFNGKLYPIKALAALSLETRKPDIVRTEGYPFTRIMGDRAPDDKRSTRETDRLVHQAFDAWVAGHQDLLLSKQVGALWKDSRRELTNALRQLSGALGLSILLVLIVLLFQFGSLPHSLIVLVAVPFGWMGAGFALWVFGSSLSLNSVLGVILLNGIAVANSIILVDFILQRVREGALPREAALSAAKERLRPILITSFTTILGMFPIALGLGEGGKVLQPLGISVAGGLWVSMVMTLIAVPVLEVLLLERRAKRLKEVRCA